MKAKGEGKNIKLDETIYLGEKFKMSRIPKKSSKIFVTGHKYIKKNREWVIKYWLS